jgi:hypothetical protein
MVPTKAAFGVTTGAGAAWAAVAAACVLALSGPAQAQNYPITPAQRAVAEMVEVSGIPLSELAPNAPDTYTVKRGDTLWGISGMFLKSPWRWPELWGMNKEQVRNPHRIYPGQVLTLEKLDGLARLRMGPAPSGMPTETVRVSPRTRINSLPDLGIPTLPPQVIEPFLNEAIIVDQGALDATPRIVGAPDERVLISNGDRAYARGRAGTPLVERDPRMIDTYRVFRNATPLKDPVTGVVLGYEAKYLGAAELVRSESIQDVINASGQPIPTIVPATIDVVRNLEEIRVGDRLLAEPARQMMSYVPRAPAQQVDASIVSVYGNAVTLAGQSQVVVISQGAAEGIESGHVLAILKAGAHVDDRSLPRERASIKLPDERNGLLMVFRTFEHLSYALVLEIADVVQVGDHVANPR